jgi:hypothetical protein
MTVVGSCNIAITLIDPDRANAPNPDKKSACPQVGSLMIADSPEDLGGLAGDVRVCAGCGFA